MPTPTSIGSDDEFILKLNPNGVTQWARVLQTSTKEQVRGVALDPAGGVYGPPPVVANGFEASYVTKLALPP